MHVGLIVYGDIGQVSGGYLYDRELVAYLRAQGDRVDVIGQRPAGYAGCLTHNLDARLLARLAAARYDVLLEDELNHPSLFALNRLLGPRVRHPIVSIVHHLRSSEPRPAWQNRAYRAVERAYLRSVDACVYNSATTRAVVEEVAGRAHAGVVAHPAGDRLGIEIDEAGVLARARARAQAGADAGDTPGPLRILFVGNLIQRKGADVLLDALARMPPASWVLTIVGHVPEDAGPLRAQAQALRARGRIDVRGRLDDQALRAAYLDAHVLAVPSHYEGFGIVYLEAMAAGLPAIGTTAGAAHEIITDGADGFLIAPGDSAALAERLTALAGDRERLARMGCRARARYLRHPTWQQTAARIRDFLVDLTAAGPRPRAHGGEP
jgi:glycosyltransferase involved in cell wall biosynthesis